MPTHAEGTAETQTNYIIIINVMFIINVIIIIIIILISLVL